MQLPRVRLAMGRTDEVAVAVIVVLASTPARANAGFPMIIAIWPASWLLYCPVVLIEAVVARRSLSRGLVEGLGVSAAADLASTLIGIPVTWFLLALVVTQGTQGWTPPDLPGGEDRRSDHREPLVDAPWTL